MRDLLSRRMEQKPLQPQQSEPSLTGQTICPVTQKVLVESYSDGRRKAVAPHGACETCGVLFHESALSIPQGTDPSTYVVIHQGRYCKACYAKPVDVSDYNKA